MFFVQWLPVNQAFAVCFGDKNKAPETWSILKIGNKQECEDYLDYIQGVKKV